MVYDTFISYKSDDQTWVRELKEALQARGVTVWLDRDELRPGDRYAEALERAIESCRSVLLVMTPRSVRSGWVREEYYRALSRSNERGVRLIPILLEDCTPPPFLTSRQFVDFRDPCDFERNVNKVIWPGITGRTITIMFGNHFDLDYPKYWTALMDLAKAEVQDVFEGSGLPYTQHHLTPLLGYDLGQFGTVFDLWQGTDFKLLLPQEKLAKAYTPPTTTVVFMANIFESIGADPLSRERPYMQETPAVWTNFIFNLRDLTRGMANEMVFVLYVPRGALAAERYVEGIVRDRLERLSHYFTLEHEDFSDGRLEGRFRSIWLQVQRHIMDLYHRLPEQPRKAAEGL